MKISRKISLVLSLVVMLVGLGACGDDSANKVSLPEQRAAVAKSAAGDDEVSEASEGRKNGTKSNTASPPAATSAPALPSQEKRAAGVGDRRFSGSFEPQRTTDIATSVGGIIKEVYVNEGDRVEKGAKLVNIDSEDYQLRVAQAQANLSAAETGVATIQVEVDRALKLRSEEAVAASMVDQLTGQLASAKAQVEVARVGVRMATKARGDALIRAPYEGVITQVNAAAGNFAGPGPGALVKLEEVQKLYLRVHVPEEYSRNVKVGSALSVRVPALGKTMDLKVSRVNPTISGSSRAFDVLAEVDNSNLEIQAGMFAEVTLAGGQASAKEEASQ